MADHEHGPTDYNRRFAIGVGLNVGFVLIEAGFGLRANSLALGPMEEKDDGNRERVSAV